LFFSLNFLLIGVLVYLIARGGKMHEHAARVAQVQEQQFRRYVQGPRARRVRRTSWPSLLTCATGASSRPTSSSARRANSMIRAADDWLIT
jgi:hypothetical protein